MIIEDAEIHPTDRILDIRIVEDDIGALASQLEGHFLEVGRSGGFHDLAAHDGGARESDFVHVHVGGEGGAGDFAEAGNDVDDSGREAGFFDEAGGVEASERGLFCCL